MSTLPSQLADLPSLNEVKVPDLWQQQAVAALRAGQDVVVQAPTGSGKTLIFELWSNQGKNRGQAIYTVPTRALANDKLAEWRARGWDVGIATGDLAENLDASIIVATLETQKNRLVRGDGPALLVIDEYQMLSDPDRGLNYELAIALAPQRTQLLLLSGSVANPQDMVKWLERLGRKALLIRHEQRPVPLEEVHANSLSYHLPSEIRGYWPRLIAKALAEDLGPVLIFAPRRHAAEAMAGELSRQLPNPNPLQLSPEQKLIAGEGLAKLLRSRVAFHHSGLSYGARAGVIEPLAKAGQLRVVVATMGLAAGINFSLRSVALAAESYRRDEAEQLLKPDEIMQMFGRAGRRGLDEMGYVIISANELRLLDAHPCHLSRNGAVDWGALLGVMSAAAQQGRDPFTEGVLVQERLFTTKPILLGVEESMRHPNVPCNLRTDAERARHVRKHIREMLNSRGEWELTPAWTPRAVGTIVTPRTTRAELQQSKPLELVTVLSVPAALEKVGNGSLCVISESEKGPVYGRALTVADRISGERVVIAKWVRRLINWNGRQATAAAWNEQIAPLVTQRMTEQQTPVARYADQDGRIIAMVSIEQLTMRVPVDSHGIAIYRPIERDVLPYDCASCSLVDRCKNLPTATGTAMLWRRLGLVDTAGVPTPRGRIVSFFSQGDGLAIAAALEDETYPLEDLIYDLADLDGGFRFCGDDNRWGGRLAAACHEKYGLQSVPGYLENGVPPKYGAGAERVVASVHKNPLNKHSWITDLLGPGDIDRVIIEWRSLLRQLAHAPDLEWPRWRALQSLARGMLNETESPTLTDLPQLLYHQTKRVDHRLLFRRH
ncbi:MAG TPA: DEAD/DEAH box helicase [Verrucomicrobiae bacterium]|nr:DEAD/DEAH box helicase [Verrucomicrobiae bacterium]